MSVQPGTSFAQAAAPGSRLAPAARHGADMLSLRHPPRQGGDMWRNREEKQPAARNIGEISDPITYLQ